MNNVDTFNSTWWGDIPVGQVVLFIAGAVIIASWMVGVTIWIRKVTKPLTNFLTDWNGEPERDGVDERPGMMRRMKNVEDYMEKAPTRKEFDLLSKDVNNIGDKLRAQDNRITKNETIIELVKPYVNVELPNVSH